MMVRLSFLLVLLVLFSACGDAPASRLEPPPVRIVRIAAAADLKFAMDELIREFAARRPGIELRPTFGSSGNFHQQIANGAPFDLYLSADENYPRRLAEAGQVRGEVFAYATGRIVLWVPNVSPMDVTAKGMESLRHSEARRIAVANPAHAPYGRAAVAALEYYHLHDSLRDRLVLGENISQAAQFVESGSADAAILALSIALAPAMREKGRYREIPTAAHPPLRQAGAVLANAADPEAAESFREFLTGAHGQEILSRWGFAPPEARE